MTLQQQQQLEETYVMHTFGRKPVEFVRGEGMRLWDDAGREYLDFLSGIGVVSLGHCHPALVEALSAQVAKLMHVSNYYYIEGRGELAEKLSNLLKANLSCAHAEPWQTFFANSGAEANECAIKLARLYARRQAEAAGSDARPQLIVTLERSFHGRTCETLAATAQPVKQEAFSPLPTEKLYVPVPSNDVAALEKTFAELGDQICGMLVEPVQGECGVYPCTEEFLQAARRLTKEHGAVLVFDEVQCGMYRCGTYPFAFQHSDVMPDIVTMAKGIAGGVPMGACSARTRVAKVFEPGIHGSTFGGSNLAIAAANVVLDTIAAEGIASNVAEVGAYFREQLAALPQVVEVRGMGLMVAADLEDGIDANAIVLAGLKVGLVFNATSQHTLRFLPPLVCKREDVDTLIERLGALL
uniref:PLP-dependent aminotransferase n=1 Tax=uncultured bacterium Contigcl_1769 TaxID=1393659 RepID=W0FT44_9BACT|nr:PLP-dependent aminotransferase [uncultured bacterium Contigcl_1769]